MIHIFLLSLLLLLCVKFCVNSNNVAKYHNSNKNYLPFMISTPFSSLLKDSLYVLLTSQLSPPDIIVSPLYKICLYIILDNAISVSAHVWFIPLKHYFNAQYLTFNSIYYLRGFFRSTVTRGVYYWPVDYFLLDHIYLK